jgi:hypothetical protein
MDQAGSFTSREMHAHYEEVGIEVDLVSPENHRSNGLAERMVRLLHKHLGRYWQDWLGQWFREVPEIAYSMRSFSSLYFLANNMNFETP